MEQRGQQESHTHTKITVHTHHGVTTQYRVLMKVINRVTSANCLHLKYKMNLVSVLLCRIQFSFTRGDFTQGHRPKAAYRDRRVLLHCCDTFINKPLRVTEHVRYVLQECTDVK